ncbi:MAG: phospholipid-binding protein MlaC [Lautropia sp.]
MTHTSMSPISRLFARLAAFVAGLALVGSVAAQTAPDRFIESLSTKMIDQLKADKAVQDGDVGRVSELVDKTLMPNVNFERMTALSVGRGWRDASPDQRARLMKEFRVLLLRTYAGAFTSVKDQQVRMKPFRGDAADKEVLVKSEIVQQRGDPIQLDYRLEKANDGWKIFDVNVLGVWLIQTYRNQFGQEISAGGIDGLIKSLADKNKSFAAGAKS